MSTLKVRIEEMERNFREPLNMKDYVNLLNRLKVELKDLENK